MTTEGATNEADKGTVKAMVRRYMENPRSVIMAVIPANVDIAAQEILAMAAEADGEGRRTLGVLTKPELVDEGAKSAVIALVEGQKRKLASGWYVVRNVWQSQVENSFIDRGAIETAFFRDCSPWNTFEKDKVGIDSLRRRLQGILDSEIRCELPKVRKTAPDHLN